MRINSHTQSVSISDAKGGMLKQAQRFSWYAKRLLKKYKNKLPGRHRCSDHRHNLWIQNNRYGVNKDATLARFAILNF